MIINQDHTADVLDFGRFSDATVHVHMLDFACKGQSYGLHRV